MRQSYYDNIIEISRTKDLNKGIFALSHLGQLENDEGLHWLSLDKLDEISKVQKTPDIELTPCFNTMYGTREEAIEHLKAIKAGEKKKVHLLALGDVGGLVLTGLKLLGGQVISEIGIRDLSENVMQRYEYELNQVAYPMDYNILPEIKIISDDELFDCDVFVFCAAKNVPSVGVKGIDMRMVQLEENSKIVSAFAKKAADAKFKGTFAVVSDPVDQLCKAAFRAAEGVLWPEQIKGFGLGVMNARAAYYAKKNDKFSSFLTEGRAFGPHGADLVIANSIEKYDEDISVELTNLAVSANIEVRKTGFKPYIAPSLSSAAISLVMMMEGKWHYSSSFLAGVWMGSYNRLTAAGIQIEHLPMPPSLYARIEKAYLNLLKY